MNSFLAVREHLERMKIQVLDAIHKNGRSKVVREGERWIPKYGLWVL